MMIKGGEGGGENAVREKRGSCGIPEEKLENLKSKKGDQGQKQKEEMVTGKAKGGGSD